MSGHVSAPVNDLPLFPAIIESLKQQELPLERPQQLELFQEEAEEWKPECVNAAEDRHHRIVL